MDNFDETEALTGTAADIESNLSLLKGIAAHSTRPLPSDYALGEQDVFCGRGCRCFNHIGNQRFRAIVESQLERYSAAKTKMDKTIVICEVVNYVRANSPNGGFVKKDPLSGRFFEVGDFLAVSLQSKLVQKVFKAGLLTHISFFLDIISARENVPSIPRCIA
jgi:hypothetical protein